MFNFSDYVPTSTYGTLQNKQGGTLVNILDMGNVLT